MFTIEALYTNEEYDNFLIDLARKRRLREFDDFKQEVFLNIAELSDSISMSDAKKLADRLAQSLKRSQIKHKTFPLIENIDSLNDESDSVLWEDNHILGTG